MLGVQESLKLLKKYKIPTVKTKILKDVPSGVNFPLVLKAFDPKIIHKFDKGAVVTDIWDNGRLRTNYKLFRHRFPNADIVMQRQLDGVELIIGLKKDKSFGELVMFGMGGIYTQIFKDVSFRACPIDRKEAKDMIAETKVSKILAGYRGKQFDVKAVENILVNISKMGIKEDIEELDLNPVIINSKGAWAVDYRII